MRDSLQARGYKSLRIKMTAVFFMFFPTIPGRGRWCISSSAQKPSRLPLPRVQFRLLSLSFEVLIPHPPYLVSPSFPPWLSINHSVAGRLTVPHLAFHISTLTHIFVMRSHLWRIPPTAIFRYLHHTHPPRLSTPLLPTKFSLKRYLHYLGLDPVGFMELDPHLRLSYVPYPKCRYSQKMHFHDTYLD